MAKECIDSCPRIKDILRGIENDNFWAGPLTIHPNIRGSEDLLRARKDS